MAERKVIVELQLTGNAFNEFSELTRAQKAAQNEATKLRKELKILEAQYAATGKADKALEASIISTSKRLAEQDIRASGAGVKMRELRNDLNGATAAGLRFRDKMADAAKAGLGAFGLNILSVTGAITGFVTIARDAVKTIADFDQAVAKVSALGGEYAANIGKIAEVTKTAGIQFGFTAVESVAAVEALAKAGIAVEDILGGGLDGALTLAAAGELSVADAADAAAKAMVQFGLAGEDVTHIADLFANSANKALGEVSDITQALNQSGQVASQYGISIEETVGTLTEFANAGLLGSDAGTSFRTMLIRLAKPSDDAAKLMEKLGINAFDAQGKFIGIEALAGQLQTQLKGLTDEQRNSTLATIFGTDAIRAASILYKGGAKDVKEWTDKVTESGEAARIAREKTNNLIGDQAKLASAYDAIILKGGTANKALRGITQAITAQVEAIGNAVGGWELLVALTQPAQAQLMTVANRFEELKKSLDPANQSLETLRKQLELAKERQAAFLDVGKTDVAAQFQPRIDGLTKLIKGREDLAATQKKNVEGDAAETAGTTTLTEETKKLTKAEQTRLDIQREMLQVAKEQTDVLSTVPAPTGMPFETRPAMSEENFATPILEAQDRQLAGVDTTNAELNDLYQQDVENYKNAQAEKLASQNANIAAAANLAGSIAGLFEEESAEYKAFATIQALISTYLGASLALTDKTIPNTFARIAAAAVVVFNGLANVRRIQGFKEGGHTKRKASNNEEVGVVHANEWVAPAWQVQHPTYAPIIASLERARKNRGLRSDHSGFFTGGTNYTFTKGSGITGAPRTTSATIASADMNRLLSSIDFQPVVRVTDINRGQKTVRVTDRMSTL